MSESVQIRLKHTTLKTHEKHRRKRSSVPSFCFRHWVVLARLNKEDWLIRTTVCDILKVIGTKKSLPSLEKIAATKDIIMAPKAKETIQAINARK